MRSEENTRTGYPLPAHFAQSLDLAEVRGGPFRQSPDSKGVVWKISGISHLRLAGMRFAAFRFPVPYPSAAQLFYIYFTKSRVINRKGVLRELFALVCVSCGVLHRSGGLTGFFRALRLALAAKGVLSMSRFYPAAFALVFSLCGAVSAKAGPLARFVIDCPDAYL